MFIGREKELATLNGLYNSDKFEIRSNLRQTKSGEDSSHKPFYTG